MFLEQTAQLAFANTKPVGEFCDIRLTIQMTFGDQRKRARYGIGGPAPGSSIGRDFRATAQAGTKACFLSGSSTRKEAAILWLCGAGRADRAAVDAGRRNRHKQTSVEARIAARQGPVADVERWHIHGGHHGAKDTPRLAIFGRLRPAVDPRAKSGLAVPQVSGLGNAKAAAPATVPGENASKRHWDIPGRRKRTKTRKARRPA